MISFRIRQTLNAGTAVLILAALVAPSMGFAQRAQGLQQQNATQRFMGNEQPQVVENSQAEYSGCSRPAIIDIPESEQIKGRTERRLQEDMRMYVTEMVKYIYCLRVEFAAGENVDVTDEPHMWLANEHNSAIEELDTVGQTYVERGMSIDELFLPQTAARTESNRGRDTVYAIRRWQSLRDARLAQSRLPSSPPTPAP